MSRFTFLSLLLALLLTSSATAETGPQPTSTPQTNCSCASVNVRCVSQSVFNQTCGRDALACARNKPECDLVMTESTCNLLGVGSSTQPVGEIRTNCGSYITGESEYPEREWQRANACCALQHEMIHVKDARCRNATTSYDCFELPAADNTLACHQTITSAFCRAYPSQSRFCEEACVQTLWRAANARATECLCEAGGSAGWTDGSVRPQSARCNEYCRGQTSPDDMPTECDELIPWGSAPSQGIWGPPLVDDMCNQIVPTPTPTPTPIATPPPTAPMPLPSAPPALALSAPTPTASAANLNLSVSLF